MNRNQKLLYLLVLLVAVAVVLFFTAYIFNLNNDANTDKSLKVAYNESRASQDKLIEDSDIIVRCVFEGEAKTETKTALTTGADGKEFTITSPVTAYKMILVENLKGFANDEFEVGLIGSADKNFVKGVEYVLFLDNSDTDGRYKLVSYNQGLNKVKHKKNGVENSKTKSASLLESNSLNEANSSDESIEIESATTKEVIDYKSLKEKIKELDN